MAARFEEFLESGDAASDRHPKEAANRRLFCCTFHGGVAQSLDSLCFVLHISLQ
jgi:hypothetical protein